VFLVVFAFHVQIFITPASASVVITSDQGVRGGKVIPLKETVDEAVRGLDYVRRIYVAQRTGAAVNMQEGRDLQLQEVRLVQKTLNLSWCLLRHLYII
jgi:acetyl-CoA synthetase